MNFITNLLSSRLWSIVYDAILILINRYIKYSKYVSTKKNWTTKNFANVIFDEIFIKFEMSTFFTSNWDFLFVSNYWSVLCFHFKIKIKLNIAFHSQTNDQTKRQNQTLKQYLKCYISYQQNDWIQWLSIVEYVYNNNKHNIIKMNFLRLYLMKFHVETIVFDN